MPAFAGMTARVAMVFLLNLNICLRVLNPDYKLTLRRLK
jgi:hypothetical protein